MPPREPGTLPPNAFHEHSWVVGEPMIGEGTWIGAFTVIDGSGGLTIGSGCDIASGVHIYTHSSAARCVSGRRYPQVDRAPVTIGDRVFIGGNAVVMMGVTIGEESIVAAGAVVTRDVPPRTVVAGVPARPVSRVELDPDGVPTYRSLDGAPDGLGTGGAAAAGTPGPDDLGAPGAPGTDGAGA